MTGPHPAVAATRTAVRRSVADVPPGSRLVVACSGGADSLALAAATAFVAPRVGLAARAVVVDHGLQPGSAEVAQRAATVCEGLGLPAEVVRVEVVAAGHGPEAAARDARYAALAAAADGVPVLLGHTLDDQAEQVLLGLARGSGARSLAGMPPRRGIFRRPLLTLPRDVTRQACTALGLDVWHDPANDDEAFARSRVRTRVLPVLEAELGPGLAAALARTADQLREDADALDALAADLLGGARQDADLDVAALAAAPAAVRSRAVRRWLLDAGAPAGSLSREHVLRCLALVEDWHGQGPVHLPGRVVVERRCGRLTFARPDHPEEP
ncbi:MAG: tRNA lysidine(34) synthetase TilS [Actinomycetes bacterium]